jgi:hypothetical protein
MAELKPLAKIVLALLSGLAFDYFAGPRWGSWNESIAAVVFTMGICFLAALSIGGAIQGPGALPTVIAFALSFLLWPPLNGISLLNLGALGFFGIFQVLPAIAGGLVGLALHRLNLRIWWFVATASLAVSLLLIGPGR